MLENNNTQLKVDIATLKKDIKQARDIHSRIDNAIEKLTTVATSIKQMLAVHEEKIQQQEAADKALYDLVENRRAETDKKLEDVHSRINTTSKEFKELLYLTEQKLMIEIRSMKNGFAERVGVLEKWRYLLIGGCIILGLILSGNFGMIVKLFS
jgi:chromosome segregation ATPase